MLKLSSDSLYMSFALLGISTFQIEFIISSSVFLMGPLGNNSYEYYDLKLSIS